jgi:hypothetical protein
MFGASLMTLFNLHMFCQSFHGLCLQAPHEANFSMSYKFSSYQLL